MKKTTHYNIYILPVLLMCIAAVSSLCSCQKKGINGELDGMWQVMDVEVLGAGDEPVVFHPDQHYYCFQLHVCQLRVRNGIMRGLTGNLAYDGKTVALDFPYADTPEQLSQLTEWGIYGDRQTFRMTRLDGHTLVMASEQAIVTCRRF